MWRRRKQRGFGIRGTGAGQYKIWIDDAPPTCRALPMAPPTIEAELQRGIWLVHLVAVWSGPDIGSIGTTLAVAGDLPKQVRVGLRPFDEYAETRAWCPEVRAVAASPIWLVLRDGRLAGELVGLRRAEELQRMVERALDFDAAEPRSGTRKVDS